MSSLKNGFDRLQHLGNFRDSFRAGQPVAELAVDRPARVDSGVGLKLLHLEYGGGQVLIERVGIAGPVSGSGCGGSFAGVFLFKAETDGFVVTVEEAANDGLDGAGFGGREHVGTFDE